MGPAGGVEAVRAVSPPRLSWERQSCSPGPMCLLAGVACRRGVTHAGSNPGRGSHTQSPLKEHHSRTCTGPRKIPKWPGWCSSSDPTLCAPGLLSPAQPRLWWEGVGGLRCWKGNLSPGQAGRVAESLERQPVPPAGPGEPEGWAEPGETRARSRWVSSSRMCVRVLAAYPTPGAPSLVPPTDSRKWLGPPPCQRAERQTQKSGGWWLTFSRDRACDPSQQALPGPVRYPATQAQPGLAQIWRWPRLCVGP